MKEKKSLAIIIILFLLVIIGFGLYFSLLNRKEKIVYNEQEYLKGNVIGINEKKKKLSPEKVYLAYHQAIQDENFEKMQKYLISSIRKDYIKMPKETKNIIIKNLKNNHQPSQVRTIRRKRGNMSNELILELEGFKNGMKYKGEIEMWKNKKGIWELADIMALWERQERETSEKEARAKLKGEKYGWTKEQIEMYKESILYYTPIFSKENKCFDIKSVEECKQKTDSPSICIQCLSELDTSSNLCDDIDDTWFRNDCYHDKAINDKNINLCLKISDSDYKRPLCIKAVECFKLKEKNLSAAEKCILEYGNMKSNYMKKNAEAEAQKLNDYMNKKRSISSNGSVNVTSPLIEITVSPSSVTLNLNQTSQLQAIGKYSDNSTTILPDAAWSSSINRIATVNNSGLVTANSAGVVIISARKNSITDTKQIKDIAGVGIVIVIDPLDPVEITISPSSVTLNPNQTSQLQATGKYSNNSTAIVTDAVWISSNYSIATVNNGLVTAVSHGQAIITARKNSIYDSISINVIPRRQ